MSRLDRKKLKRMIINEMNMMGMTDMPAIGDMSSLVCCQKNNAARQSCALLNAVAAQTQKTKLCQCVRVL